MARETTPSGVPADRARAQFDWVPVISGEAPLPGEARARERYQPGGERSGTALCLSGGGYRAALFHLGALRRLNELGILGQIDTFASVSGGSIVAAKLATHIAGALKQGTIPEWPTGEEIPGWGDVATELREFMSKNIRTLGALRMLWPGSWPMSTVGVRSLEKAYREITTLRLDQLPDKPRFIFCATDLAFATGWFSEHKSLGDYQAGFATPHKSWSLARAVAASSCFPPVFNPLPIEIAPAELKEGRARLRPDRSQLIRGLRLSDGGVYDNLGVEPVWRDHERVLVSDGGASLNFAPDRGLFKRIRRYMSVSEAQGTEVRKRWLISNFVDETMSGTYWGVASAAGSYYEHAPGYSQSVVADVISHVRTDLDAFSEVEQQVLENHGYLVADAAVRTHLHELLRNASDRVPSPPFPGLMNEGRVRLNMAQSNKRRLLGRWRHILSGASGESEEAPSDSEHLLRRYCPAIQYDSDEHYFADSPAVMSDLAVRGSADAKGHATRLLRADGEVIAEAGDGPSALTLDFLRPDTYSNGSGVLSSDYLDEWGGRDEASALAERRANYRRDAELMHKQSDLADVCFGHARLDGRGRLWLQYWFFFYYDEFKIAGPTEGGLHEGDWEMVQLRIGRNDRVVEATYAQHNYCQRASWEELEHVESEHGLVPLIYCAWGSHASYMRVGKHKATLGADRCDGGGRQVRPRLEIIGDADDYPEWARWPGVWGSTRKRAWWDSDSPRGPREHMQWFNPAAFAEHARPGPTVPPGEFSGEDIPLPDETGTSLG